jgi:predicted DNA-binding transcriptional regulator AlpA
MTVKTMNDNQPKAAITVSRMCSKLEMSRSQFYWHVKRGTFHAPLRLSNGRPYFNASQVEDNLKARELGIGVNGEYVLFYERSETPTKPKVAVLNQKPHLRVISAGPSVVKRTASTG